MAPEELVGAAPTTLTHSGCSCSMVMIYDILYIIIPTQSPEELMDSVRCSVGTSSMKLIIN